MYRTRAAFTLVELSIVLVILGLLVGGVLAGQSLIRAAELRAIGTERAKFLTGINAFKDKYFALPGDMNNAESYWGTAANCPGAYNQGSTTSATCNGNGDGKVYYTGTSTSPTANEVFRFWQHLAAAGLIEGTYNGVTAATDGNYAGVASSNSPVSKMTKGLWFSNTPADNTAGSFTARYVYRTSLGNVLNFGGVTATWNYDPLLTPPEAYNVDMKLDDGNPIQGRVMAGASAACNGNADGGGTSTAYVLTSNTVACFLYFPFAY